MLVPKLKCPFGDKFICIAGIRFRQISDAEAPAHPIKADLPGLMFVWRCDCCAKVTGGLRRRDALRSLVVH